MNLTDYEIADITADDLLAIYDNLDDRMLEHYADKGFNRSNFLEQLSLQHKWVVRHKSFPIFMCGYTLTTGCVNVWLMGTKQISKHVRAVNRLGRAMLNTVRQNYPNYAVLIELTEKGHDDFRWYERAGFRYTQYVSGEPGNRRVLMEYR